jgi:integrase
MGDHLYRRTKNRKPYGGYVGWFHDARGRRVVVSTGTHDRKIARDVLRAKEREAYSSRGAAADAAPYALMEALKYLLENGCSDCAEATVEMYAKKSGHLLRLLGDRDINVMVRDDVQGYINKRLDEGASKSTVSKELVALRRALTIAFERNVIRTDPRALIPRFRSKYVPKDRYLSEAEFAAVMRELPTDRHLWMMIAVYAGPRFSEIERLRWEHVDLRTGWVTLPGTKTAKSKRHVPLAAPLAAALCAVPKERRFGPVVRSWTNVRWALSRVCKRLQIGRISPNDLRRTFASWLKQAGRDSMIVARLLGHTSSRMVEQVYGHLNDGALKAAIDTLPAVDPSAAVDVADEPAEAADGDRSTVAAEAHRLPGLVGQAGSANAAKSRELGCPGTELNRRHGDFQSQVMPLIPGS